MMDEQPEKKNRTGEDTKHVRSAQIREEKERNAVCNCYGQLKAARPLVAG